MHQTQSAGVVVSVDAENGISVRVKKNENGASNAIAKDSDQTIFVLPPHLAAWYQAPPGAYRDSDGNVLIENPDYLVTWDVHKTQAEKQGDHEWWEWLPSAAPKVN